MNIRSKALLGAAFLAAFALKASADVIPLGGYLDISVFPNYGDENVLTGIQDAITDYNAANDPDLPYDPAVLVGAPDTKVDFDGGSGDGDPNILEITISLDGPYSYVFLHWGGPDDDAYYDNPQLFFVSGESEVTFFAPISTNPKWGPDGKQFGLSFYSVYGVPDGGTTVLMLGATVLMALGVSRRLKSRQKLSYIRKD